MNVQINKKTEKNQYNETFEEVYVLNVKKLGIQQWIVNKQIINTEKEHNQLIKEQFIEVMQLILVVSAILVFLEVEIEVVEADHIQKIFNKKDMMKLKKKEKKEKE